VKVVGIAEKNLDPEIFQNVLRNSFDARSCTHRHEDRSVYLAVGRGQSPKPRSTTHRLQLKSRRHSWHSKGSLAGKTFAEWSAAGVESKYPRRHLLPMGKGRITPHTLPRSMVSLPIVTGKLNLLGPALPGLKKITPAFVSSFGMWLWP
jgi:hypothetical protein